MCACVCMCVRYYVCLCLSVRVYKHAHVCVCVWTCCAILLQCQLLNNSIILLPHTIQLHQRTFAYKYTSEKTIPRSAIQVYIMVYIIVFDLFLVASNYL